MIHPPSYGARIATMSTTLSPYPASYNGNPWLYGLALVSLICIAVFGLCVVCWMARDIWKDRFTRHPATVTFRFRAMMMLVGWAAFQRALPEVIYNTCYGEVTGYRMGQILAFKRGADIATFPIAIGWMTLLMISYPELIIQARNGGFISTVYSDAAGVWPRLAKPALVFVLVVVIASLIAYAKGTMGHVG